jgi:hypothetical protein
MELRLLELAIRLLDPRKWRTRLMQLGGGIGLLGWIWFRAASRADVVRAVADAKHYDRDADIHADNLRREREKLSA